MAILPSTHRHVHFVQNVIFTLGTLKRKHPIKFSTQFFDEVLISLRSKYIR